MNQDFRAFAGASPTRFFAGQTAIADFFATGGNTGDARRGPARARWQKCLAVRPTTWSDTESEHCTFFEWLINGAKGRPRVETGMEW